MKRLFDTFFSVLLLVLLLPIFAIVAMAIKLDDGGKVFFLQDRLGRYGKVFQVFKFRTMIENADSYLDKNGMPTRDRVTKVGRFLRLYSIDELPQVLNILKGDMSLVGPRPLLVEYLGIISATDAAELINQHCWALLPIDDEVTKYAFPSKSSVYALSGAGCWLFVEKTLAWHVGSSSIK